MTKISAYVKKKTKAKSRPFVINAFKKPGRPKGAAKKDSYLERDNNVHDDGINPMSLL